MIMPGTKSEEVKALQSELKNMGLYNGDLDGDYGGLTFTAVMKAQSYYGLSATGTADDLLLAKLSLGETEMITPTVATVPVKSAWSSKINWTGGITLALNMAALFGLNVPSDVKEATLTGITAVGVVATWVIKTFFTTSITPASAARL